MIKTQFIDTDYLKENSLIEFNVDDAKLNPLIFKAQDMYIAPILGSDFYNHLQEGAASGGTLTTGEYNLIVDYIMPAVVEYTAYMSINQVTSKITNKSVAQENSQYAIAADRANRTDLKNEIRDLAEFYLKRLQKFLCDHSELFPIYQTPSSVENLPKNSKSFFNGIYLPKNGGCYGCDNGHQYK